jgi:sirohydrochlorin ferrochelatase
MRVAVRALVLVLVFAGVGWFTARAVMGHVASQGAMQPEVQLAGAMAGLFAGGAVTLIVGIAMAWSRKR